IHVPINVCGNTVNVVGLLNPAFGNVCQNISSDDDDHSDNKGDDKGDWAGHDSYNR
ncbi:chaplin, partial [Streptomyces fildesensis]|uniref:chaplin n=1 Tax=Streptomyces fildesensis TaxID=375757 RepID=UPI00361B50D6